MRNEYEDGLLGALQAIAEQMRIANELKAIELLGETNQYSARLWQLTSSPTEPARGPGPMKVPGDIMNAMGAHNVKTGRRRAVASGNEHFRK
jgi:hypothetical protein